jgi:MFS transporter, ACS family, hexuronate transporter
MKSNFFILFLAQVTVAVVGLAIPPAIPFIQPWLRLSYAQVGSLMTCMYLGAMIISLPSGGLTDRLGIKRTTLLSQILTALAAFCFSLIGSYGSALLCAVAIGIGYGMVNPPTTKGILVLVGQRNRALAMSAKQTGVPLAGAIAAAIVPPLAMRYSWETSFVCTGFVIGLSALATHLLYDPSFEHTPGASSEKQSEPGGWRAVYRNRNIVLLSIAGALCSLAQATIGTYAILYAKDSQGLSLVLAAFSLTLINIAGVLGRLLWGIASDRLFKGSRRSVLQLIAALILAISLLLGLTPRLPLPFLFLLFFLLGFSAFGWNGVFLVLGGELAGRGQAGRATGFIMTIVFLGNLTGPILFGKMIDVTGGYRLGWIFMAAAMGAALCCLQKIRE